MVALDVNGGFATACNAGAAQAGTVDWLVFLNNDTIPIAGWLDALLDGVEREPDGDEVGIVGAKLLFPNGTVQHAGVAIGRDRWPRHLYTGFPGEHEAVNRPKRLAAVTAACMLVRRDLFEQLGGFDAAFHNGYEDIDLCHRATAAGYAIRYEPSAVLYHLESVTRWPDGVLHSTGRQRPPLSPAVGRADPAGRRRALARRRPDRRRLHAEPARAAARLAAAGCGGPLRRRQAGAAGAPAGAALPAGARTAVGRDAGRARRPARSAARVGRRRRAAAAAARRPARAGRRLRPRRLARDATAQRRAGPARDPPGGAAPAGRLPAGDRRRRLGLARRHARSAGGVRRDRDRDLPGRLRPRPHPQPRGRAPPAATSSSSSTAAAARRGTTGSDRCWPRSTAIRASPGPAAASSRATTPTC